MKEAEEKLSQLLDNIYEHKAAIAIHRDRLRDIKTELDSVIDSLDTGIEYLENGHRDIEYALDELSQFL